MPANNTFTIPACLPLSADLEDTFVIKDKNRETLLLAGRGSYETDKALVAYVANATNMHAVLVRALIEITNRAPTPPVEPEDYDDTESAYNNGYDVSSQDASDIATKALREAGVLPAEEHIPSEARLRLMEGGL